MFAERVPHHNPGDYPHRFHSGPGEIGKKSPSQYRQTSSRLPLPERIFTGISENMRLAIASKISFLQVTQKIAPSVRRSKIAVFTLF